MGSSRFARPARESKRRTPLCVLSLTLGFLGGGTAPCPSSSCRSEGRGEDMASRYVGAGPRERVEAEVDARWRGWAESEVSLTTDSKEGRGSSPDGGTKPLVSSWL